MELKDRIEQLKKEQDAVILAHYYVSDEVQAIADYIGDSFYLSKLAVNLDAKTLVVCGVSFMGESAKILNPEKKVLNRPDSKADCAMAHIYTPEKVAALRAEHPNAAVVCYINSTAELKTCSDVCVTSANALKIVSALPNEEIIFIPDENLGRYIAQQLPDKKFIFNDGRCPIHAKVTPWISTTQRQRIPMLPFCALIPNVSPLFWQKQIISAVPPVFWTMPQTMTTKSISLPQVRHRLQAAHSESRQAVLLCAAHSHLRRYEIHHPRKNCPCTGNRRW